MPGNVPTPLASAAITCSLALTAALALAGCDQQAANLEAQPQAQREDIPSAVTPVSLRVLSLNIYGHATMPEAAPRYAALANDHDVDVLGIQEGVDDWQVQGLPTDYSRSETLHAALGKCWEREYQVYINTCRGMRFISHERFDLTDGPNAARTGERAELWKNGRTLVLINVHWDHESAAARSANAIETAAAVALNPESPTIVLGDFNTACDGETIGTMTAEARLILIHGAAIDCIFSRHAQGHGWSIDAAPSDHPGLLADIRF